MMHFFTRIRPLLFLLPCALFWQACNTINPAEPTPTYIHIDSFHFQENSSVTLYEIGGVATLTPAPVSHKITSVWVYYNNNPVGIFDLPATFPVLATGNGVLKVAPSVAVDGQNNMDDMYPYYTFDTFLFAANPGAVINHTPTTEFYNDAKVKCISNFENGTLHGTNFVLTAGNRSMQLDNNVADVVYGSGCGIIQLSAVGDSSIDSTFATFTIPLGTAFIEFDYNSTIPFYVGLQANLSSTISSTPNFLTGVSPSNGNGWQKFYLQVDGFTGQAQGTSYNLFLKAVLADGQTSGKLLIDNIQLVTF